MLQVDGTAPYAPVKAITSVIERHRHVGLPEITTDILVRMGVTESLAPRTMQSVKLLGLVDDNGKPTEEFEAIRKAPSDQLGAALASLIRDVYAPVFAVVDPTTASAAQIEDAFRGFTPSGQRGRMVTLFTGLMAFAGMVAEAPKQTPGPKAKPTMNGAGKPKQPRPTKTPPPPPAPASLATGDTYTVELASGGKVSVIVSVNLFALSTEDRSFVIDVVDKLKGYPKVAQPTTPKEAQTS